MTGEVLIGGEAAAETPSKGIAGHSRTTCLPTGDPKDMPPQTLSSHSLTRCHTAHTGGRCRQQNLLRSVSHVCHVCSVGTCRVPVENHTAALPFDPCEN